MIRVTLTFALLALCITLVFGATVKEDGGVGRVRREIAYRCRLSKAFQDYNKVCCKLPLTFFPEAATKTCLAYANSLKGGDKAILPADAIPILNGYMLNLLQNDANIFDLANATVRTLLTKPVCFAECALVSIIPNLIKADKTLNATVLSNYLQSKVDASWKSAVNLTVAECGTILSVKPPMALPNGAGKDCNGGFLAYMQCINYKLIGKCPVASEPTGPADVLAKCGEGTMAKSTCDIFK